jgi:hypothetical protein
MPCLTSQVITPGDILDSLVLRDGDLIAMIGYIQPVAIALAKKGCAVAVIEQRPVITPLIRPRDELPVVLSRADISITVTALLNKTLHGILKLAKFVREIVLMGPSTLMVPEAFQSTGIAWLACSRILKPQRPFQIVMEGGKAQALFPAHVLQKVVREVMA